MSDGRVEVDGTQVVHLMAALKASLARGPRSVALTIPSERERLLRIISELEGELAEMRQQRDDYRRYWTNVCADLHAIYDRLGEATATIARLTFLRMGP